MLWQSPRRTFMRWRLRATAGYLRGGDNFWGQVPLPAGLTNIIAVAAGLRRNMALREDGTVVTWGRIPIRPPEDLRDVVAIAIGSSHYLALRDDGTVVAWGSNFYGQTNVPS